MPIRMLRDWTDSEPVNALDPATEVLFVRLIMKADDFGRFTANPKLIRSLCFPLKDGIRESDISRQLAACEKAGLLLLYEVNTKPLLEIVNFGQRLRKSRPKYPSPELAGTCQQHAARSGLNGIETEFETETETESETEHAAAAPHRVLPSDLIVEWNRCIQLTPIRGMTEKRKTALRARERNPTFVENWKAAIVRVATSDFCCGINDSGWKATIDWFLKPETITKILEGQYDNRNGKASNCNDPRGNIAAMGRVLSTLYPDEPGGSGRETQGDCGYG